MVVGAVAYTANLVPVWEGIREYFRGRETDMDFVLFSNYERQIDALLSRQIDIAWNTNLAWVRTVGLTSGRCRALAMRDIDITFRSVFVQRAGDGMTGLADLRGRRLALGSRDSTQATILPLHFLRRAGFDTDVSVLRFDRDAGKHGDTGRSELDCLRAVIDGEADAAAIGITTWDGLGRDDLMKGSVAAFWTSPEYCHCNFTALDLDEALAQSWTDALLAMDWNDADQRRVMEMEGIKREWVRPQLDGYISLFEAIQEQGIPLRW